MSHPVAPVASSAEQSELIAIGRIVKPFGIKGAVRVLSLSSVPGRFRGLTKVTLVAPSGRSVTTTVTQVREDRDSYVVAFEALTNPDEAVAFRGGLIKIPREQAPPLPEGQYYEFDLIGMTVADETGRRLGTLEEILETSSNHVFVVRGEGREVLIPATRGVVASVDVAARAMTVRLVEGLLDAQAGDRHAV
ncbi:MAG: 16S rRNA processing protein RimM [Nitrospirae bacterium]|nr:16S rRNA processing protein RimM [Nitrospirota bacterium]